MLELLFSLAMIFGLVDGISQLYNPSKKQYRESKSLFDCIFR